MIRSRFVLGLNDLPARGFIVLCPDTPPGPYLGRAVQVDPIKLTLKPPGTKHLKVNYDKLLSNFAFKFNMGRDI
jgi:hypothetical protein